MRVFFSDPGLHLNIGHHPNTCESVVRELNQRNVPVRVLSFVEIEPALKDRFAALPLFRYNLNWRSDNDPICGPAYAFHAGAKAIREDLDRFGDFRADDVFFMPWTTPALFWGLVQWMNDRQPDRLPSVVASFLDIPDVTFKREGNDVALGLPDYRVEPSAMFLRLAARHVTPQIAPRLRLGCYHPEGVFALQAVLGLPVEKLPAPQHATTLCRLRGKRSPLTVGMIGHQRGHAKGVQHFPEIVRGILQSQQDVRILVHDGSNDLLPDIKAALVRIAAEDKRATLNQQKLDIAQWPTLLDSLDLIVCPYSPSEYRLISSGVHNEAIANAIPSVVPANTTLAAAAAAFGGCSVTYAEDKAASIVSAVRELLTNFDRYARAAADGAERWKAVNGPGKLVDAILGGRGSGR